MTRQEAIKYLINPVATSTKIGEEKLKEFEAYSMAIEALRFVEHFDLLREYQSLQEVVYCKDCDREYGSPVCPIQSEGWAINTDTFFCAWGERKGGDDK